MTRAPWRTVARPSGLVAVRSVVVLAIVLFGMAHSHAVGHVSHTGSAAESHVAEAKAILTAQRHLLGVQFPQDDAPDKVAIGADGQIFRHRPVGTVSRSPHQSLFAVAIRILPTVRGPPVT